MKQTSTLTILLLLAVPLPVNAQDFDQVRIQVEQVSESIYMLMGAGGNIAVCVGEDGTFIVDDEYAPLTSKVVSAVAAITDDPVDFVINTHWHADHTGGNESLGGAGAVIVSHGNSRRRMETDQFLETFDMRQEAYSKEGLPKITFDRSVQFHVNGEIIDLIYLGHAHTDGDAIVFFRNSNVVHMGDVFVRYGLPFIDEPNGGSINGMIDVVNKVAELTDENTVFIPGHGQLSDRDDMLEFHDMLVKIRDEVQSLINQGRRYEEIAANNPADGYPTGSVSNEVFLKLVYDSLANKKR